MTSVRRKWVEINKAFFNYLLKEYLRDCRPHLGKINEPPWMTQMCHPYLLKNDGHSEGKTKRNHWLIHDFHWKENSWHKKCWNIYTQNLCYQKHLYKWHLVPVGIHSAFGWQFGLFLLNTILMMAYIWEHFPHSWHCTKPFTNTSSFSLN